jgi:hypothetical protein
VERRRFSNAASPARQKSHRKFALLGNGLKNPDVFELARAAVARGKLQTAYGLVAAFKIESQLLIATGVLTHAQGDPLVTGADLLLQSLRIGGGF